MDEIVATPQPPPETGLDIERKKSVSAWLGVVEAIAVLLACVATTVLFGVAQLLVQAPRVYDLEFDLHARESAGSQLDSAEELIVRVEAHGFSGTWKRGNRENARC